MNSKKLLSTIILLVVAVALAICGFTGVKIQKEEEANADSPFTIFDGDNKFYSAESASFMQRGQHAVTNIEGCLAQIQANAAFVTEQGGDASAIDALAEEVTGLLDEANAKLADMQENHDKLIAVGAEITEETAQEDIDKAANKLPKYRNRVKTTLKELTRIEAFENKKSLETLAVANNEMSAGMVLEAFPEAELPAQFVPAEWTGEEITKDAVTGNAFAKAHEYFFWLAGIAFIAAVLCAIGWKSPVTLGKIGHTANKNMMLVALIAIVLIFFVLTNHTILSPVNVSNIITQNAYIIIMACGMLLCIVCSANIDLSVGRVIGFISALAAKLMIDGPFKSLPAVIIAILICLIAGMIIGAWQGFWISYMGIPAFVVTLADQLLFYGITMMILQGFTINNFPAAFETMFNSYILKEVKWGLFGGTNIVAVIVGIIAAIVIVIMQINARRQRRIKGYSLEPLAAAIVKTIIIAGVVLWLFIWLAKANGVPSVLITVGLVLLIYAYITSKTVIGRHLYAMGGNRNAARLSGVKTQQLLFLAYVNMGFLAALAGLVYAARLNGASPQAGAGDETFAIASCYIGGASAAGGIGTIGGALIGALTMGVIKNGMSILGLGQDVQQIVLGLVLLMAVVIDVVSKQNVSLPFFQKKAKPAHKA